MTNKPKNGVILVGYSGHAFVVAEALMLSGYQIIGYLDKEMTSINLMNLEYLGFEENKNVLKKIKGNYVFPSIGDNCIREKIITYFENNGFEFITAIHANSNISNYASIGKGTLVARGANINPFAAIGKGVIINTGAIVEHECVIKNFVHIAPGAVLAGNVSIGKNSFIGANAVVKQGISIGENVVIGAGAVVVKNVENNIMLIGNPAKPKKVKNNG